MRLPKKNEIRKPSKTLAGVTPIAVMCKPKKCKHGNCIYCPSLDVPQSYTPKSPPVLRASLLKYDPYKQIKSRLKAFKLMNHPIEKIELIIMGGNFLEYPINYQTNFIKRCYDALNDKNSKNLEEAKKTNQKSKYRCVALCLETRPDTINNNPDIIKKILDFGCTRVELGVQCLDDEIYKNVNRGHKVRDVIEATRKLKNSGFKIGYHMMLGLPGSNPKKDFQFFKKLFKNQEFKPDQLKIYPCQVIKGAELENLYYKDFYHPYSKDDIIALLIKIMKIIPGYCRVMRVMREIPPDYLTAGTTRIDLRKDIDEKLKKSRTKIREIRFREIGFALRDLSKNKKLNNKIKLKITKYKASDGDEYFLEIINKNNILFALLRLRIFKSNKELQGIIRELHVYGKALGIREKPQESIQHQGLGKKLLKKAEEIAKKNKIKNLKIISGVGVREYYIKQDYEIDENRNYMIKDLSNKKS
ncbi:tRNA uridine(34) 5-carboxymethylaminomethyl modification radical SAM/GNAT enzyme Elp3 [Candidatus Pacearchaeota archaeon]|nr:tRNA uridine(34) 5-carboxymethylaminomethyl modification radical SAM/GNAT enzyme Elp3 [Candidatus Pacearchaeota archaeon]MBD3283613.1 tRNA uridine(34) 5-carboxymethylaminomethyl modification radical SAM/GNAT enzyme Elp3 [Candidatus Pacearchaeota archaeon]